MRDRLQKLLPNSLVQTLIASTLMTSLLSGCNVNSDAGIEQTVRFRPASFAERRFATTIRQQLDFSCGAAVLATILTYYYHDKTSEAKVLSVLQTLPNVTDWKQKAADGFSFADLIFAADKLGYAAQGAQVPVSELSKISGPVVVHFDKKSFQHFVVLRKITDEVAYVSDPIIGDNVMSISDFTKLYTNNAMALWKPGVELPKTSQLQAIKDGLSVSNVVGPQRLRVGHSRQPML